MKCTFITTVRNEETTIAAYLRSLASQTRPPDEVIIVDGESDDATVHEIEAFRPAFAELRVIVSGCNIAEGRNLAVRQASGDVVAMSDAGSVLERNWLEELVRPFEDEGVEIVAGNWRIQEEPGLPRILRWYFLKNRGDFRDGPTRDTNPSARSFAIRRSTWLELGGHPEFLYAGEDTLFNHKWRLSGRRAVFAPEAVVRWRMHKQLRSFGRQVRNYARGRARQARADSLAFVRSSVLRYGVYWSLLILFAVAAALPGRVATLLAIAAGSTWTLLLFRGLARDWRRARRYGLTWSESAGACLVALYGNWQQTRGALLGVRDRLQGRFDERIMEYLAHRRSEQGVRADHAVPASPRTGSRGPAEVANRSAPVS